MVGLKFERKSVVRSPAMVPPGQRIYAIGDVHGRLDLLDRMLAIVANDDAGRGVAETRLIFVGDLIDRGPHSAGVVARCLELQNAAFILGNHEEVFLDAMAGDVKAAEFWSRIGGRETMLSYGMRDAQLDALPAPDLVALLRNLVPAEHVAFMEGFCDMIEVGDYVFVHAGIRPAVPLAEQQSRDLRWIREPFLGHAQPFERIVVHGHSITSRVDLRANRIGIDTGAFKSGKLSAIALEADRRWTLTATAKR